MLQRIQTVFLISVAIMLVLYLVFPVWIGTNADSTITHRLYALFYYQDAENGSQEIVNFLPYAVSGGLAILSVLIAFIEIFSFKNRMTQIKLGAFNALLISASLVSMVWFTTQLQELWPDSVGHYAVGVFFPVFALISNMIANRFIRKDERLIKSMDRIR